MRDDDLLWAMVVIFAPLSLISVGGGSAIVAGAQHEVVAVRHYITSADFVQLFAIARASPGPGTMLATLVGWKVAGWLGAVVATISIFLPSSLLCYGVVRWSSKHSDKRWYQVVRSGLAPIGVGLTMAGVMAIFRVAGGGGVALVIAIASTSLLLVVPRFPVLLILAMGGGSALLLDRVIA